MSNLSRLKRVALIRKGADICRVVPKRLRALRTKGYEPDDLPPILINSLPKSGTHLLTQIVEAVPKYKKYGSFIASTPSISMRLRSESEVLKKINGLVSGEIACGHIHFTDNILNAIRNSNVIVLFIYRDPRDVFWSEMQYLLMMNKWHRAGRYARKISDPLDRFRFFINGFDGRESPPFWWPRFRRRLDPYLPWIDCPDVCSISYEDLSSEEKRRDICVHVATLIRKRACLLGSLDVEFLANKMVSNINPKSSHTYREGRHDAWRLGLSDMERDILCNEVSDIFDIATYPAQENV